MNTLWTKCKPTRFLIVEAILGKIREVYVTFVANADKGQWHGVMQAGILQVSWSQSGGHETQIGGLRDANKILLKRILLK